ncbi:MAG TPA: hypothetical protein VHU43_06160 [Steroidobacteraceae bacterium]|nr:hypothetical protein [Steroidobacteraceae bacterium]
MQLMPLEDSRWATYSGGYRSPYNVVPLIHQLKNEGASSGFWEVVWDELHHHGDVGEASYALVPYLVDHQSRRQELDEDLFHFCVIVELQQPENGNPPVPPEVELSYAIAMRRLPVIGTEKLRRGCNKAVLMGVAAATALAGGHRVLARAYAEFSRVDAIDYLRNLNGFTPSPADN